MQQTPGLPSRLHKALALGEDFLGPELVGDSQTLNRDLGAVFTEVTSGQTFKASRFALSPKLGLALGVSVGFETVSAVVVTAGGHELVRHLDTTWVPDQLADPEQVQARVDKVVAHALCDLLPAKWEKITASRPTRVPLLGAALATPLWANQAGRPAGTRYADDWTDDAADAPSPHRGHRMLADALRASGVEAATAPPDGFVTVANMFACEAMATAYRWSPERDETSPLATLDPNWRSMLVVHAGCGLGAATIRVPPFPLTDRSVFSFLHARVHGGALGGAGAIGHLIVSERALAPCSCGTEDETHLEQVASGYALAQALLERATQSKRTRLQDRRIELMRDLKKAKDARFSDVSRRSGNRIGRALGPVATTIDPVMTVASGLLADEAFRTALADALLETGKRPCGAGPVNATDPDDIMYLAAKGAALLQMRTQAWRRWPGFHALGQPTALNVSSRDAIEANLAREAAWISYTE